jgi:hypothetical protein
MNLNYLGPQLARVEARLYVPEAHRGGVASLLTLQAVKRWHDD